MTIATTIFHIQGRTAEQVEAALTGVFAREERPLALRVEGSYNATLARLDSAEAAYRYLLLRPHGAGGWTPLLELGSRTDGLDAELSQALDGATIFTVYQYGEVVSGYRVTRAGAEIDRYCSDPTAFESAETHDDAQDDAPAGAVEEQRGRPERFADLLPAGTTPADFTRVVLAPGWWETHDAGETPTSGGNEGGDDEDELVDEVDRMRCIALALELWSSDDYPLTQELEDLPNKLIGPAIALAWGAGAP
jgi:hypothetical protein